MIAQFAYPSLRISFFSWSFAGWRTVYDGREPIERSCSALTTVCEHMAALETCQRDKRSFIWATTMNHVRFANPMYHQKIQADASQRLSWQSASVIRCSHPTASPTVAKDIGFR